MDGDARSKSSCRLGSRNCLSGIRHGRVLASCAARSPRRSRRSVTQRVTGLLMNDIRFAFRKLRQSPAFSFIAIVTLALGIGLNTAIFSLINDLFLRSLPFKDPEHLVHMYSNARERNLLELPISAPRFQHLREGQTIFDEFGGENVSAFTLTGLGDAVHLFGGRVTSNYFDILGVRPIRGRNFLPEEEEGADVAMVTENFWQKRM